MTVTHTLTADLVQPGIKPRLYAMQFDANTRLVAITLLCRGQSWEAPADAAFGLSYCKDDGTRGFYTEGITCSANTVSVTLAPQVLTCPGTVEAALVCTDSEGHRIAAFPFEIQVAADPAAGSTQSEDYFPQGNAVLYTPQTLTEAQQAQARANLGLEASKAVACIYNGVELPALPSAAEDYPYLCIYQDKDEDLYWLWGSQSPIYIDTTAYGDAVHATRPCMAAHYRPAEDTTWDDIHFNLYLGGQLLEAYNFIWCSHDIKQGETVVQEASDPVPVSPQSGSKVLRLMDYPAGDGKTLNDVIREMVMGGQPGAREVDLDRFFADAKTDGALVLELEVMLSVIRISGICACLHMDTGEPEQMSFQVLVDMGSGPMFIFVLFDRFITGGTVTAIAGGLGI